MIKKISMKIIHTGINLVECLKIPRLFQIGVHVQAVDFFDQ